MQPGDVLVAANTGPAFNLVLPRLAAIVTDRGGLLSHAAIVAREFGIPAVVGVPDEKRGETVKAFVSLVPGGSVTPDELIALALELGCRFSIDSDAHAPGQLDFLDHGAARATALGVPPERIVTTWPREELLTWTRTRRAPG